MLQPQSPAGPPELQTPHCATFLCDGELNDSCEPLQQRAKAELEGKDPVRFWWRVTEKLDLELWGDLDDGDLADKTAGGRGDVSHSRR